MANKKKKEKTGSLLSIIYLILFVIILSSFLSLIGIEGNKTSIVNGSLESSLITVRNILSLDGITYLFSNAINHFKNFEALILLMVAMIGIGVGETSGLFKHLFEPLKNIKFSIITFLIVFISIISSFFGEVGYVFLIPIVAIMYKYINKNPLIGIITVFIGITLGYASGLTFSYNDYILGTMTQMSANVEVDPSYIFNGWSSIYVLIATTLIMSYFISFVIRKNIVTKMKLTYKNDNIDELVTDKKALLYSFITFILCLAFIIYMIIPSLPKSGLLLSDENGIYLVKLMSNNAPFRISLVFIITLLLMVTGYVYGTMTKNFKDTHEFGESLSANFNNLGYAFVLIFFVSQLIGIIEWTNVGEVIACKLIDFLASTSISGILLIVSLFIITIIIGLFIPSTITKWNLLSPMIVPLFMQSNITPDFTQFVFRVADAVGKSFTFAFPYFIIMYAFFSKYSKTGEEKSLLEVYKLILPSLFIITGIWLLVIVGWYIIGLPLGNGVYPTL